MQAVYIRHRRWVTALAVILSVFCIIVLAFGFYGISGEEPNLKIPYFVGAGIMEVILLLYCSVQTVKLFKKYIIVGDERGITLPYYGLIEWENIAGLKYFGFLNADFGSVQDTPHIRIELKDRQKFRRALNVWQRMYFLLNFRRVNLPLLSCSGKNAEIFDTLNDLVREYAATNDGRS